LIKLGRIELKNPIIASSGALGFGRGYFWERPLLWAGLIKPEALGAVITKTITQQPRIGNWKGWNPWQVLQPIDKGWVNNYGLTNKGIDWFLKSEYKKAFTNNLIVSINDYTPRAMVNMVKKLDRYPVLGIELNISCPNTGVWTSLQSQAALIKILFKSCRLLTSHPLIVKIGYLTDEQRKIIARTLIEVKADAVDMINTIPFFEMYPNKESPLRKTSGVSGSVIKDYALEQVAWFSQNTSIPIIGGGGISSEKDIEEFLNVGATAVSIGSAHILKPWISTSLAKMY